MAGTPSLSREQSESETLNESPPPPPEQKKVTQPRTAPPATQQQRAAQAASFLPRTELEGLPNTQQHPSCSRSSKGMDQDPRQSVAS